MNWIEVIRLRALPGQRAGIVKRLEAVTVATGDPPDDPAEMRIYLNLHPTGDMVIVLFRNTDGPATRNSRLALSLLNGLKDTGLVNHSVWVEAASPTRG